MAKKLGAAGSGPAVEMVTTGIHVPRDDLHLLRIVAAARSRERGGRPSISAVIVELIAAARPALEKEARSK